MGRPIRRQKKKAIYFITNRTLHQKYFFRPSEEVNATILGLLAKMADRYDIEIFAFVFMSNHFHLLARSQGLQMQNRRATAARERCVLWPLKITMGAP